MRSAARENCQASEFKKKNKLSFESVINDGFGGILNILVLHISMEMHKIVAKK